MFTDEPALQAAACEVDRDLWQQRFTHLLRSGVVQFSGLAGGDCGLAAGTRMNGRSAATVLVWLQRTLAGPLQAGAGVALDLSGADNAARVVWRRALRSFLAEARHWPGRLSCSLRPASVAELNAYTGLGIDLFVRYDLQDEGLLMALATRSHGDRRTRAVPAATGRALSVLHAVEKGQAVLPQGMFEVAAGSAWLVLDIDFRRLGVAATARAQLRDALRFADNLIDSAVWPAPMQRLDALLNRRVALRLTHIGDAMCARGLVAGQPESFRWVQRRLQFIRNCIVHESMLLAQRRGPFPGLCAGDLVTSLTPRYGVRDAQRLLRNSLLRHRHLLTLSPLEVLPVSAADASPWLDLLPAIACADTIGLGGPDCRARLSVSDWHRLLRLTAAIAAGGVRCRRRQTQFS